MHRRGPARIVASDGRVTGIETIGVVSVFDEEGRFSPVFDADDVEILDTDTVILAIGQAIDLEALGGSGPDISPRRTIGIDVPTGRTSLDGVWSGGDAANGPRTLIDAIADGRKSAADIHRSFGGEIEAQKAGSMVTLDKFHRLTDSLAYFDSRDERDQVERADVDAQRAQHAFVDIELDVGEAAEAAVGFMPRLFLGEPEFDLGEADPASGRDGRDLHPLPPIERVGEATGSALILDESKCIRCALCIERCPPNALSMGVWNGVGVPAWT